MSTSDISRPIPNWLPEHKWQVLGLMIAVQAFVIGIGFYSFTFWIEPWMEEFGASRGGVLMAITLLGYAAGVISLFAGRWIDLFPAKLVVSFGLACFVGGMFLVSIAPNLWVIWAVYALVLPASASMCGPLVAMTLVSRNFNRRRGMALGIVTLGTSLGGIIFPFIIALLLSAFDWRTAFAVLALSSVLVLGPLTWIILSNEHGHSNGAENAVGSHAGFRSFAVRPEFWILAAVYLITWFVFTSVQHNVRPFAIDLDISVERSATFMSTLAFCMIIGKLVVGTLADRLDNRFLFIAASLLLAAGVVALSLSSTYLTALSAFAVLGLAAGAYLPLQGTLYATTFGTGAMGRAMGMAAPIQSFSATGAVAAGWSRDMLGTYAPYFQGAALLMVLIAPLLLLLPAASRQEHEPPVKLPAE